MTKHNGYSNRETWAVALHLSNYEDIHGIALDCLEESDPAKELKYWMKGMFEFDQENPGESDQYTAGMWKDIGDLSKVNWSEVAEALNGLSNDSAESTGGCES